MVSIFRTFSSPGYERDVRGLARRNPLVLAQAEHLLDILEQDPYNQTRKYDIKKLTDVKPGQGQWRIRAGNWRLRYDIFGQEVVLYSFRHRREAY